MTSDTRSLSEAERLLMRAVMDRLVPPVDDLPGAGTMGLLGEVEAMAQRHAPYGQALLHFVAALAAGFPADAGPAQDSAIAAFERAQPAVFQAVLEVVYLAYYAEPRVHARIGWRTGPIQPRGFSLPPFDDAILEATRRRAPFWRQAPS
jgi:hypothetical protein